MIKVFFKFKDKNYNDLCSYLEEYESNKITFNDQYMDAILSKLNEKRESVKYLIIDIQCNLATIIVDEYTLTDTFEISSTNDFKSSFFYFKAKNVNLRIMNIDTKILETHRCNLLLVSSNVGSLYCDMNIFENNPSKKKFSKDFCGEFDINGCEIDNAIFEAKMSRLTIQGTSVKIIQFYYEDKEKVNICDMLIQNCEFKTFNFNFNVDNLIIRNSYIDNANFMAFAKINYMEIQKTKFDEVFGCDENTISKKSIEVWKLVKKSNHKVNINLYCLAGYEICRLENQSKIKMEKNILKKLGLIISDVFLRASIGYSYKPVNVLGFTILSIFAFALLYTFFDSILLILAGDYTIDLKYLPDNMKTIFENLYWSGITFTTIGYGEVGIHNWISKFLAIVEGCLGIATMSLFVIALGKKYLD